MHPPKPEGSTYIDKVWGYVMEKRDGKWVRQHRLVMEEKLGRKLLSSEIVHHKDENRVNNDPDNLELTNDADHKSYHSSKKNRWSEDVKSKMSISAKEIASRPGESERRSQLAKKQHREGRFGY